MRLLLLGCVLGIVIAAITDSVHPPALEKVVYVEKCK